MSQFSNLVRTGKLNHGVRVIKTRKGAIAEAGWPGRKLQVKGNDPAKAVKLLKALGFKVACQAQWSPRRARIAPARP